MNKPIKPRKPFKFVFPPQKKSYSPRPYWGTSYNGNYEDPIENAMDNWDGESDPKEHWKNCSSGVDGSISLADAVKIAEKKGLSLKEMHFGLIVEEDHIGASLFSLEEMANEHYSDMVKEADYQKKEYQRKLKQYKKEIKSYPLRLKQYLEHQKQEAEQKLRELERE